MFLSSVPVLQCLGVVHWEYCSSLRDCDSSSWRKTGKIVHICPIISNVPWWWKKFCNIHKYMQIQQMQIILSGARRPRATLWLLGADWLSSSRRCRQSAEWRVRRGRPAEQPTHADQRRERLKGPESPIHCHAVLQGPPLQPRILRGEVHTLKSSLEVVVWFLDVCMYNLVLYIYIKGQSSLSCKS